MKEAYSPNTENHKNHQDNRKHYNSDNSLPETSQLEDSSFNPLNLLNMYHIDIRQNKKKGTSPEFEGMQNPQDEKIDEEIRLLKQYLAMNEFSI